MAFDDGWNEKARVKALLIKRGPAGATTADLCDPAVGGYNGQRRARQLRKEGWPVHCVKLPTCGLWLYWLGPMTDPPQLELWPDDHED
jgi:hypothetical protein